MTRPAREIDIVCRDRHGLSDYAVSLARAMSQSRRVTIVTSSPLDERFHGLDAEMVLPFRRARHYPIDIWKFIWFYLARRRRTLLFQNWLFVPGFEGLILRLFRLAGHRLFITVHDTLPHHQRPWSRGEISFFYRGFHGLIAHSAASETDLRALGVTAPITVVPHANHDMFITREVTRAEARRRLGIAADKVVYLQFGHIDTRKGCFEFLETARRCAGVEEAHFIIAGSNDLRPPDRARFDAYRDLPNLSIAEEHVPFDDVQVYFAATDVVAAPYREGTTSGVYRLGVAFGKPVVATEIGDLRDAIARGTAFSIGQGPEVVDRFEAFVRAHLKDLGRFAAEALARMREEAHSNSWAGAAQKYLALIDANTPDEAQSSHAQRARGGI